MARGTIREQISEIESVEGDYPGHRGVLDLYKDILGILLDAEAPQIEMAKRFLGPGNLGALKERMISQRKPLIGFVNPGLFNETTFNDVSKRIVTRLMEDEKNKIKLIKLHVALESLEIPSRSMIEAVLDENTSWFQDLSKDYGVEAPTLLYIFSSPLRPFFEELAREVNELFAETWWEPSCPVCGRVSAVARVRDGKRYMACSFCGAEHVVDRFLCVYCGNRDPNTLGFVSFDGRPEFEIDYCERCNNYIKVIKEPGLGRLMPGGLEDMLTQELDALAQGSELGLRRG